MSRKTTDTTNAIEAAANPPVTLTPQALQALIEEVTALRAVVAKPSVAGRPDRSAELGRHCQSLQTAGHQGHPTTRQRPHIP
jgi:hypothetical protein